MATSFRRVSSSSLTLAENSEGVRMNGNMNYTCMLKLNKIIGFFQFHFKSLCIIFQSLNLLDEVINRVNNNRDLLFLIHIKFYICFGCKLSNLLVALAT